MKGLKRNVQEEDCGSACWKFCLKGHSGDEAESGEPRKVEQLETQALAYSMLLENDPKKRRRVGFLKFMSGQ